MKRSLAEIAATAGARLIGDGHVEITSVASIRSAGPGSLVFVDDEKFLASALQSGASAVVAGEFAANASLAKALLISDQPKLAFARAARLLDEKSYSTSRPVQQSVHSTAVVDPSAVLGEGVRVAERAVVRGGVQIAENTQIGAGCVIGDGVKIGRDCEIYPNVTIYAGTVLGDRVIVQP